MFASMKEHREKIDIFRKPVERHEHTTPDEKILNKRHWKLDDDEDIESDILNIIQKMPTTREKKKVAIKEENSQLEEDLLDMMAGKPTKRELRMTQEKRTAQLAELQKALGIYEQSIGSTRLDPNGLPRQREESALSRNERLIRGVFKLPGGEEGPDVRTVPDKRPPTPKSDKDIRELARIRNMHPEIYEKNYQRKKLEVTDNNYSPGINATKSVRESQMQYSPHPHGKELVTSRTYNSSQKAFKSGRELFETPYYVSQPKYNFNAHGTYNPALSSIFKMAALEQLTGFTGK